MTNIYEVQGYTIWTNKAETSYMILDEFGDCIKRVNTMRKAMGFLNKVING